MHNIKNSLLLQMVKGFLFQVYVDLGDKKPLLKYLCIGETGLGVKENVTTGYRGHNGELKN